MTCKLGRIENFDPRSKKYSVRNLIADPPPRSFDWYVTTQLNQGNLSACVGFSWSHYLSSVPNVVTGVTEQSAINLYYEAQKRDEWPGTAYEGSSVLAGIKSIQDLYPNLVDGYHWAFGLDELVLALGYLGPVVLGIPWYSGMFETDTEGMIRRSGQNVGGHAILASGVDIFTRKVRLHQSWGPDWGFGGDCFIGYDDLAMLLSENGEACVATGKQSGEITG